MEKIKIGLAISGFVLIGFIMGFLFHRQLFVQRIQHIADMRNGSPFQNSLLHFVGATETQKEELTPILKGYGQRLDSINKISHEQKKDLFGKLSTDVKPYLEPAQLERLEHFLRRFQGPERMFRKRKSQKNHHRN